MHHDIDQITIWLSTKTETRLWRMPSINLNNRAMPFNVVGKTATSKMMTKVSHGQRVRNHCRNNGFVKPSPDHRQSQTLVQVGQCYCPHCWCWLSQFNSRWMVSVCFAGITTSTQGSSVSHHLVCGRSQLVATTCARWSLARSSRFSLSNGSHIHSAISALSSSSGSTRWLSFIGNISLRWTWNLFWAACSTLRYQFFSIDLKRLQRRELEASQKPDMDTSNTLRIRTNLSISSCATNFSWPVKRSHEARHVLNITDSFPALFPVVAIG